MSSAKVQLYGKYNILCKTAERGECSAVFACRHRMLSSHGAL